VLSHVIDLAGLKPDTSVRLARDTRLLPADRSARTVRRGPAAVVRGYLRDRPTSIRAWYPGRLDCPNQVNLVTLPVGSMLGGEGVAAAGHPDRRCGRAEGLS